MKDYLEIESVKGLEVLDSRGNTTVQVEVVTIDGSVGVQWFHLEHQQVLLKLLN